MGMDGMKRKAVISVLICSDWSKTFLVQYQIQPIKHLVKKGDRRSLTGDKPSCEGLQPRGDPERKRWIASLRLAMTGPPGAFAAAFFHSPFNKGAFLSEQLCVKHNQRYLFNRAIPI
jgi:hypothetical protein